MTKMLKFLLICLQILIEINLAKSAVPRNGFKYIGSFRSRFTDPAANIESYEESNYFFSQNAGAWNSARQDCTILLGTNGTLISIESEEEWKFIKELADLFGFASDYWTSGIYDASTSRWRWAANDLELPPFTPWASGHPTGTNAALRVLIEYSNQYSAYWKTVSYTQLQRYICEVQVTTVARPCFRANDLAIVLDSSGSIGDDNFETAKEFVERLANSFTVYNNTRISFITYANNATVHIDLTNSLTRAQISSTILNTAWKEGGTATDLGIELATSQLSSNAREAPMNMVILTDGKSDDTNATLAAAQAAITAGIRTFSIGITANINQEELLAIAGNDPSRVFTTDNFDDLIELLAPLSLIVCPT